MEIWNNNDIYLTEQLVKEPTALQNATKKIRATPYPPMEVSPAQGKFLYLLAKIQNASRILEIGTYYGYSTIWLAKAVPEGGVVVSIEQTQAFVEMAKENIAEAGLYEKVQLHHGDASLILCNFIDESTSPFDMVFIDAHKPSYPKYLNLCLKLSKPGTIIIGDNVILGSEISLATNPKAEGVRDFIQNLSAADDIESTALQTVGIKGYDGFTIGVVGPAKSKTPQPLKIQ
ncbi:MAG: O-methyltransferase [Defluviitaleaceae bacterium]|nr:O-methyltransferase [Defluviitaleaceae bacterium]